LAPLFGEGQCETGFYPGRPPKSSRPWIGLALGHLVAAPRSRAMFADGKQTEGRGRPLTCVKHCRPIRGARGVERTFYQTCYNHSRWGQQFPKAQRPFCNQTLPCKQKNCPRRARSGRSSHPVAKDSSGVNPYGHDPGRGLFHGSAERMPGRLVPDAAGDAWSKKRKPQDC